MKRFTTISFSAALLVLFASNAFAQSSSTARVHQQRQTSVGQNVPAANQVSIDAIDHSVWNGLLGKYVDDSGGVNYAALQASAQDSAALDHYINTLSTASSTLPADRNNTMAFWVNAYNAVTVKGILQEFPTTSIRNHTSETGGYNLWKNLMLNVGGRQVSLDSIEHKLLRPMGDGRIHFAIVCAAKSCPRLLNEAYTGQKIESQLVINAKHFFSQPQNFQYDRGSRAFRMSAILEWFGSDFGQGQAAQLRAIASYLPTQEAQAAASQNSVSVSYLNYNWDLNKQTKSAAGSRAKSSTGSGQRSGSSSR